MDDRKNIGDIFRKRSIKLAFLQNLLLVTPVKHTYDHCSKIFCKNVLTFYIVSISILVKPNR